MRVSLIHMNVTDSIEDNLKRAKNMMRQTVREVIPDFICLPEYFSMTFGPDALIEDIFDKVYEPTVSFLKDASEELGAYIVGGTLIEKHQSNFYNTCMLLKDGKVLGKYRKIHLTIWEEKLKVKEGKDWFGHDTEFGKIGILICADLFYPESVKTLASMGAEAVFLPVSASRTHPSVEGHPLTIAKAKESLVFILKAGNIVPFSKGGRSAIIAPWGVVREAKNAKEEEIVSADLDIPRLRECRQMRARMQMMEFKRAKLLT